jgi:hypothetical protein
VAILGRSAGLLLVAAILIAGGLIGESQLVTADWAITGRLPAKGPIVGVTLILYGASIALGFAALVERWWLGAVNLAGAFAVLYLIAASRPINLALAIAYGVAFVVLLAERRRFGVELGPLG